MAGREATEILALLREGTPEARAQVERMLGKKITVCPPARGCYQHGSQFLERLRGYLAEKDDIMYVRAVLPRTGLNGRKVVPRENEHEIVPGRTLRQIKQRGVTQRVIDAGVREGWLQLGRKTC